MPPEQKHLDEDATDKIIDSVEGAGDSGGGVRGPVQPQDIGGSDEGGDLDGGHLGGVDNVDNVDNAGSDGGDVADDGLRGKIAQWGVTGLDRFSDDESAVRAIVDDYRLMSDRYSEAMTEIEAMRATGVRRGEQASEPPETRMDEEPAFWPVPKFDPSWKNRVERDPETGFYRHIFGKGTPQVAERVNDWASSLQAEQEKFWGSDGGPQEYLRPFVEHVARKVAQEVTGATRADDDERGQAVRFLTDNEEWLFSRDRDGNVARDPRTNRPAPSEEAKQFIGAVAYLEREGVPVHLQGPLAKSLIFSNRQARSSGAVGSGDGAASDAETQRARANMDIQRRAAQRGTGRGGTVRSGGNQGAARAKSSQNAAASLKEKLRSAMKDGGFRGDEVNQM